MHNYSLERFVEAQKTCYMQAYNEVNRGKKRTHWMWYIFPQIKGLGMSETSKYYAIQDEEEAKAYLRHSLLGARLFIFCHALMSLKTNNPEKVFGPIDSRKLQSCMTLFYTVCQQETARLRFKEVLDKFFNGELCQKTIEILEKEAHVCQG